MLTGISKSFLTKSAFAIAVALGPIIVPFANAPAQGLAQATITGIPPILTSPSVSGQIQRYNEGSFALQFIYTSPNAQPVPFAFRFLLEHEGQTLIDITSNPTNFQPGVYRYQSFDDHPQIKFPESLSEVVSVLNTRLGGQINRTGLLPEGMYVVTIEPVAWDAASLIPTVPGTAAFFVSYAEPPFLITPAENVTISPQFPIFSWTPVAGLTGGSSVDYELLIVEVWPNQSPQQAVLGNPPQLKIVLNEQSVFTYGQDQLPFQDGKQYAWQVTAREQTNNAPILNEGRSEIFTFRVSDGPNQGGTSQPFSWRYPDQDPFLLFDFGDAVHSIDEVFINGRNGGTVAGGTMNATFDNVTLSPDGRTIRSGRITLDRPMAIRAIINQQDGILSSYAVARSGASFGAQSMLQFEPGIAQITADGMIALGQGRASVRHGNIDLVGLSAVPSSDFLVSLSPLRIARGRMTFSFQGVMIGYVDPSGFHSSALRTEDLIALVPARLPLPALNIAYVELKRGDDLLVDVSMAGDGSIALTPKPGEQIEVVFACLPGQPRIPVALEDVRLTAGTHRISGGRISGGPFDEATREILTARRIPVALDRLGYTPVQGLVLSGPLRLFGETIGLGSPIGLRITESGSMQGTVNLTNLGTLVHLVAGSDKVALRLGSVGGLIDVALLSGDMPNFSLTAGGDFLVRSASETAASLGFTATVNGDGQFTLLGTSDNMPQDPASVDLGNVRLAISRISCFAIELKA